MHDLTFVYMYIKFHLPLAYSINLSKFFRMPGLSLVPENSVMSTNF